MSLTDFAFAIWDEREQRLFCARDYPGVRPFYYHAGAQRFVFASDIEGLLAAPGVPHDLDYGYLAAHLSHGSNFPHFERTFFQQIHKLPPAHAMTVSAQGVKIWPYWQPGQCPEVRYSQDEDYLAALQELLQTAVACRTSSAFPVGAHISGGLDSSSVGVLAERALREDGKNLAAGYCWSPQLKTGEEYLENDDRLRVLDICNREGISARFTLTASRDVAANRLRRRRLPFLGFLHEFDVRRQAEALGIRTLLSGWGGDELIAFNGRGFFLEMLRHGRWLTCFRELQMRADLHGSRLRDGVMSKIITPWIPDALVLKLRPESDWAQSIQRWKGGQLPAVFRDEMRAALEAAENLEKIEINEKLGVRPYQLALLQHGHLTHRIEGWAAQGAKHGITYAYPLLDRRIVEFALGLPPEMFMKNGWKRWLFRSALEGILPDDIRWNKSKSDPALNADRQLHNEWGQAHIPQLQHNTLEDWLTTGREFQSLDANRVREAIANVDEEQPSGLHQAMQVELLLNRELAAKMETRVGELEIN